MELLQKHFDIALDTPDGIKKLRELILTLAMQGKLVPQDPNDQSAIELLKEIEAEKKKLIAEGKIRKQEPLPPIKPEDIPYEVPEGWEWVRLGDVAMFLNGDRSSRYPNETDLQDSGIPFFGAKDMMDGQLRFDNGLRFITPDKFKELSNGKLIDNDFVMLLRGTVGKIATFNINQDFQTGFINAQMLIIRMFKTNLCDYFRCFFLTSIFRDIVTSKITGSAIKQMPANVVPVFLVPLPPLAEQKRIVAKIDQLMALCDKLEAERNERDKKRLTIHTSAMNRLLTSPDKPTFDTSWQFITKYFDKLYSVSANVGELKKAILQLAVMGKLVPQDPNDQSASELLKEIEAEKKKLIAEGKIRKQEPLPPIKPEDLPYEVPDGWEWVRLGNIVNDMQTGIDKGKQFQSDQNEYNYFKMNNITIDGKCNFFMSTKVNYDKPDIDRYSLKDGDFLFNTRNSLELVGKTCIFETPMNERWLYNNNILRITLFSRIDQFFINKYFNSSQGKNELNKIKSSTTNVAAIYQGQLIIFLIPLPPLAEQKRIVAKVDKLMALCDSLDKQIVSETEKKTAILNAVLSMV